MNSKFLITLGIIIVVIFAGYFLYKNQTTKITKNPPTASKTARPTKAPEASVLLTKSGFEPTELKIKAGTRVIWTNNSGGSATVNSDNHPAHLLYPFLNLGTFSSSSSVQLIFEKAGTYSYHNHLNPTQKGKVIVN
ncbi:cupredoxin domain-containing protein [Patescibacteria group bacterium]|nr:cupredoxin domain-containing protein [Patescibacteria group bacterium]